MQYALNKIGRPIFIHLVNRGSDNSATWARQVGNSWRKSGYVQDNWKR